jgi:hypothetical protein
MWRTKPPDAESAAWGRRSREGWGRFPESVSECRTYPVHAVFGAIFAEQLCFSLKANFYSIKN